MMVRILSLACVALFWSHSFSQDPLRPGLDSTRVRLLIRCDDIGMCHSVNEAFKTVLRTNLPVSASVMFACPWYQEAVDLLKGSSNVSVGIHLTLNAEWKHYRWGPVLGPRVVPSLVDSSGHFFPSRALLFANKPSVEEAETELRAQIERALGSGLPIDYVDYHMGAAVSTPEFRDVVEKLAGEYNLAISRYFGEQDVNGLYAAPIASKRDTLIRITDVLAPGPIYLLVFHVGLSTPEMDALVDLNTFGLPFMSKHREAELHSLVSAEFREILTKNSITLLTYRQLIRELGLDSMQRPAAFEY